MGQSIIYFEDPFWVGVFEQNDDGKLSVEKVTFGTEPRDCEVRDFILDNYDKLRFSSSVDVLIKPESLNPKRRLREAKRQIQNVGIGTKSQQSLKLKCIS